MRDWREQKPGDRFETATTEAKLYQIGNWVTGTFMSRKRKYFLSGTVQGDSTFTGTWSENFKGRAWHGAFQFEIHYKAMTMSGRWIGVDKHHKKINYGEWEWKRPGELLYPSGPFIYYDDTNEAFAKKLHGALNDKSIRTWFLPNGEQRAINDYECVILVCSESLLSRPGVLNEIERALELESKEDGSTVFISILLDDTVFDNRPVLKTKLLTEVVDFQGATENVSTFNDALEKLLDALKKAAQAYAEARSS
ncbi:MAG: toll/interleukin-1 receptor domain-containing protein [Proteobacteria bacterium]|nr:toll/interleukin-1 receptor domain-containing protein [Pseudomonadota bacterium]